MGDPVFLAYDYPVLGAFWTIMWVFLSVLWIVLMLRIVVDLVRDDDLTGWGKAGWLVFVVVLPFLGVFAYLVVRGGGMGRRELRHTHQTQRAFDDYFRKTGGRGTAGGGEGDAGGGGEHVRELATLAELRGRGDLSDEEYQRAKDRLLR